MITPLFPWFVVIFLVGLVIGLLIGVFLASMLVKGHYSHFLNHTQPLKQPVSHNYAPRDDGYLRYPHR